LSLDPATGIISGTPTVATSTAGVTFIATAQDSGVPPQKASQSLTIRVGGLLTVSTLTLPPVTPGLPYSATLSVTGGFGPYTWSISAGALPTGLTLSPGGVISGTVPASSSSSSSNPTSNSFSFTVKVVDFSSPQQSATQALTLTIAANKYKLSFYAQPTGGAASGQVIPSVKVLAVDPNGYPVRGIVVTITLSINPTGAVLGGTNTATTGNNGIAIFANQTISKPGTGYQMEATAPSASPAFSNLFNVK
jgi:hypothetical protein